MSAEEHLSEQQFGPLYHATHRPDWPPLQGTVHLGTKEAAGDRAWDKRWLHKNWYLHEVHVAGPSADAISDDDLHRLERRPEHIQPYVNSHEARDSVSYEVPVKYITSTRVVDKW